MQTINISAAKIDKPFLKPYNMVIAIFDIFDKLDY